VEELQTRTEDRHPVDRMSTSSTPNGQNLDGVTVATHGREREGAPTGAEIDSRSVRIGGRAAERKARSAIPSEWSDCCVRVRPYVDFLLWASGTAMCAYPCKACGCLKRFSLTLLSRSPVQMFRGAAASHQERCIPFSFDSNRPAGLLAAGRLSTQ
jgi:hypothetical protein